MTCGYLLFTYCSLDNNKNKYAFYRGEDPMKKFNKDLKGHITEIIKREKKEMLTLSKKKKKKKSKTQICAKKNSRTFLMRIKLTVGFVISAITQENKEVHYIVSVI